jgi:peptide/nickel transport system substrate-binding protein
MRAYVGDGEWKPVAGCFVPGSPLYNEEGGEILKGPRQLDLAKRLLAEAGYAGEPITLLAAQNVPHHKAYGDVTVDLLQHLGVTVDYAAVDGGTLNARVQQKSPPNLGGWHMFASSAYGFELANPAIRHFRADGNRVINGFASSAQVEAEVAAWFDAKSADEEKTIARRLNKAALDHVLYAPLGMCLIHSARRKNVSGIMQAPVPLFWGVSKSA